VRPSSRVINILSLNVGLDRENVWPWQEESFAFILLSPALCEDRVESWRDEGRGRGDCLPGNFPVCAQDYHLKPCLS